MSNFPLKMELKTGESIDIQFETEAQRSGFMKSIHDAVRFFAPINLAYLAVPPITSVQS